MADHESGPKQVGSMKAGIHKVSLFFKAVVVLLLLLLVYVQQTDVHFSDIIDTCIWGAYTLTDTKKTNTARVGLG